VEDEGGVNPDDLTEDMSKDYSIGFNITKPIGYLIY